VFGVGVIICMGIFVLTERRRGEGRAAVASRSYSPHRLRAGCALLREFASTGAVAGSRTPSLTQAWRARRLDHRLGPDLELALGASTVAVGWSNYFADVMKGAGSPSRDFAYGDGHNFVAAAIVLILTAVICVGIKISSQVNLVFVVIQGQHRAAVIVAGASSSSGAITRLSSRRPARKAPRARRPLRSLLRTWGSRPAHSESVESLPERALVVLRLYRFRHRRDRSRGDEEASAGTCPSVFRVARICTVL